MEMIRDKEEANPIHSEQEEKKAKWPWQKVIGPRPDQGHYDWMPVGQFEASCLHQLKFRIQSHQTRFINEACESKPNCWDDEHGRAKVQKLKHSYAHHSICFLHARNATVQPRRH